MSRLDSGFPGTIAGPEAPPCRRCSRESSCSPPSFEFVWQAKQFLLSTGRTRDSKNSPGSCAAAESASANNTIDIRNRPDTGFISDFSTFWAAWVPRSGCRNSGGVKRKSKIEGQRAKVFRRKAFRYGGLDRLGK